MRITLFIYSIFFCINCFGPRYSSSGIEPAVEKQDPPAPLDCETLTPPNFVASANNNKKTIEEIDSISATDMLVGDPIDDISWANGTIGNTWGSGEVVTTETPPGFSKAVKANLSGTTNRLFNIKVNYSELDKGDIVFISFYVKAVSNANLNNGTTLLLRYMSKEGVGMELQRMILTVPETGQWQRVYYPVRINSEKIDITSNAEIFQINSPVEFAQEFFIGGFSVKNYKKVVPFLDFPNSNEYYNGIEDNAEWRVEALKRIENIRMKDITITFKDIEGNSIKNICVTVKQKRHAFHWGGSINTDDPSDYFFEKHFELFQETTLQNFQKWKSNKTDEQVNKYLDPAIARGNTLRAHAVHWAKINNTPSYVKVEYDRLVGLGDPTDAINYVKGEFNNRITEVLTKHRGKTYEWDLINEPNDGIKGWNSEAYLGKDIMYDWIDLARATDPNLSIAINEYTLIDRVDKATFNRMFTLIKEMVDTDKTRNPPNGFIDAIGLQGHFNGASSIIDMQEKIDELSALNKKIKLTESDIFIYNEDTQGKFMRDILILFYSNQNFDGVTFWNWEYDASKVGEKALEAWFRSDSDDSMKPIAKEYMDTVYNLFWIQDSKEIQTTYSNRLYYGKYEVTATINGQDYTQTVDILKNGPDNIEITLDLN